ncbi:hypothetical protein [Mycolicibacterium sediminis]|nr:hypothetical protein [Mycolicibacterium sediminis]
MNRAVTMSLSSAALVLSGVAGATSAHAQPPPPGTLCSFTLSPPHVVQVDGADMVTATVAPDGCAGAFRPRSSVVCVQAADSSAQCSQGRDADIAQVFTPYRPGTSYTATGRGLGALFNDASEPNWQLLGPITAVL